MMRAAFALACSALLLAGCGTMAPNYERPAAPVAESFPVPGAASGEIGRASCRERV